jgi:hypothetical protein
MMTTSTRTFTRQGPPPASTPEQLAELQARLTGHPQASHKTPPPPDAPPIEWANYYHRLGFALCALPPGEKGPRYPGWQTQALEPSHWASHPEQGMGAILGLSRLVSLDIDDMQASREVFQQLGLSLESLLADALLIQGNPERMRAIFRQPSGWELGRKALSWPARPGEDKPLTVFELRAGPVQDCLPPSTHPDTKQPYRWLRGPADLPGKLATLPEPLAELWQGWSAWKPGLEALCPWNAKPQPEPKARTFDRPTDSTGPSVIDAFNAATDPGQLLEQHSYKPAGPGRWIAPQSSSGLAGVVQMDSGLIYSHHGADPLAGDHAHDAFSLFVTLEHQGDTKAAIREAARQLGIEHKPGAATAGGQQQQQQPGEWLEPEPLTAPLPDAEPYPVEALGDLLAPAVSAMVETIKAPVALCAQSVLAAAAFAAQAHFDVATPWGETKPTTLFFLTTGTSGERKSATDEAVLGAAKAQEREESQAYAQAMIEFETALASWKAASEASKRQASKEGGTIKAFQDAAAKLGPPPDPPIVPIRFLTDPTVEGLAKLLAQGQPSVALFSDEGGLLIGGHALNSDNALKTLARWCKLWDGAPFDRVRAGDGATILYGRRMALHQLAQPSVMAKLLTDEMANGQGFLARCLVAWPESTIGTRHAEQFSKASDRPELKRLFAVLKTLFETIPATGDERGQELTPYALQLTPDAERLALAAHNQFETLMAKDGPLVEIRDRAAKALDNALRLAAVLAVMDKRLAARQIEVDHLQRGLVLVQWYLAEALRIRGAAAIPQATTDAESLLVWIRERGLRRFRSASPLQFGPLRDKDRLAAAVAALMDAGWLRDLPPGSEVDGVKAKKSWEVNPHVL